MDDEVAWRDRRARLTLMRALGRAVVVTVLGLVATVVTGSVRSWSDDDGTAWLVGAFAVVAAWGLRGTAYALRSVVVMRRHPWRQVQLRLEDRPATRSYRHVAHLTEGGAQWDLTFVTPLRVVRPFRQQSTVLVAGERHHSAVLATTDRREVAWGRRSRLTDFMLRQDRRAAR